MSIEGGGTSGAERARARSRSRRRTRRTAAVLAGVGLLLTGLMSTNAPVAAQGGAGPVDEDGLPIPAVEARADADFEARLQALAARIDEDGIAIDELPARWPDSVKRAVARLDHADTQYWREQLQAHRAQGRSIGWIKFEAYTLATGRDVLALPTFDQMEEANRLPNSMIVRLADGTPPAAPDGIGLTHVGPVGVGLLDNTHRYRVDADVDFSRMLEAANAHPAVVYAEPDYVLETAAVPNDPNITEGDWWLEQIDAYRAWDLGTDATAIGPVGVFDNGIEAHEDLDPNRWVNPDEVAGNGIDDDGNGYVDDVNGITVSDGTGSHGTPVAGTICGRGDNGIGSAGSAWDCRLMELRSGLTFSGAAGDFATATAYAIAEGSRLSNHSWRIFTYSQVIADTVDGAEADGHLFVTAAGNESNDIDAEEVNYPARLPNPNVLTVAASNADEGRVGYSSWGATSVDLAAPTEFVTACSTSTSCYAGFSGTSQATPVVTGAIALAWSQNPGLSATEIRQMVLDTARPVEAWDGLTATGGILDMHALMEAVGAERPPPPEPPVGVLDDFETDRGWTTNPDGTDTATNGFWEVGSLQASPPLNGLNTQIGTTTSGVGAIATGVAGGTAIGTYDIDNGVTTVRSAEIPLPPDVESIEFNYYFAHLANTSAEDFFSLSVVADGTVTPVVTRLGAAVDRPAAWSEASFDATPWAGTTVRFQLAAADGGEPSLIEAAVDDISFTLAPAVVDIDGPTVTLDGPGDGQTLTGPDVTIDGSATDASGVTETRLFLEDRTPGRTVRYWDGTGWTEDWAWYAVPNEPGEDGGPDTFTDTVTLDPGDYRVVAFGWDPLGNRGDSGSVHFTVTGTDTRPPTATITQPTQGQITNQPDTTITATLDDDIAITTTRLFLEDRTPGRGIRYWNGTNWTDQWAWYETPHNGQTTSHTITLEPGNYRTVAFAWDAAGNRADSGSTYFTITGADTIAPDVVVTTPNGTVAGPDVTITAALADSVGVTETRLFLEDRTPGRTVRYWDGTGWTEDWAWYATTNNGATTTDTVVLEPGSYRTVAFAWDAAGNRGDSGSVHFTVTGTDTRPPTATITQPTQGQITNQPDTTITATLDDDIAITTTRLFLEDRTPGRGIRYWNGTNWTDQWAWYETPHNGQTTSHTITLEPGNYRTVAFAWDAAGNRADSGSTYFTITGAE